MRKCQRKNRKGELYSLPQGTKLLVPSCEVLCFFLFVVVFVVAPQFRKIKKGDSPHTPQDFPTYEEVTEISGSVPEYEEVPGSAMDNYMYSVCKAYAISKHKNKPSDYEEVDLNPDKLVECPAYGIKLSKDRAVELPN